MLDRIVNRSEVSDARNALSEIKESMNNGTKISSFTHNFYKYPACFPETFPRSILKSFSKEDSWILDPFSGGGTTAVEALASHRNFVGSDINDLAIFSAKLKTILLNRSELEHIDTWIAKAEIESAKPSIFQNDEMYFQNIPAKIENFVRKAKTEINKLTVGNAKHFITGALLRFTQLEVERENSNNQKRDMQSRFFELIHIFIEKNLQFNASLDFSEIRFRPTIDIFQGDVTEVEILSGYQKYKKEFDLVVTSPPYPEKHILYNKWQVKGRVETQLPYWIIGSSQVMTESNYTMGGRNLKSSLEIYLCSIFSAFHNINHVMKKNSVAIQVVAFTNLKTQLPGFLEAMNAAGFDEIRNIDRMSYDGRLWRKVPNQRWYNRVQGKAANCQEVVLFHRKKKEV